MQRDFKPARCGLEAALGGEGKRAPGQRETGATERASLVGGREAIVLVERTARGAGTVGIEIEAERIPRLLADVTHRLGGREDAAAAHVKGQPVQRRVDANEVPATLRGARPEIKPKAGGQVNFAAALADAEHGRREEGVADHKLIVEIERVGIVLEIEDEGAEERHAGAVRRFERRVEERQQAVTEPEVFADDRLVGGTVPPGFVIVLVDGAVAAAQRHEAGDLVAAREQLPVAAAHESREIGAHEALAQARRTSGD